MNFFGIQFGPARKKKDQDRPPEPTNDMCVGCWQRLCCKMFFKATSRQSMPTRIRQLTDLIAENSDSMNCLKPEHEPHQSVPDDNPDQNGNMPGPIEKTEQKPLNRFSMRDLK